MIRQTLDRLTVRTRARGFYEITRDVQALVEQAGVDTGLCTPHTRTVVVHVLGDAD